VRLTDISVRQLSAPEKGQRTYFDDTFPNFGCRISQGGTRSFFVQHGASRQFITIGRYPVISLAQARAEAKRILAERTLGKIRPLSTTFEDAKTVFLRECEQRNRKRTVEDYRRLLKRLSFGRTQLGDITPDDIWKKIDRLRETPSEQNHAYVALRVIFRWAARKHYLTNNPMQGMTMPAKLPTRERVLSAEELASIYRIALSHPYPFGPILSLLILTGQRRGEIGALKWDWINEKERRINLPADICKNGRAHTFPYGKAVAKILNDIPRQGDYLFSASREHVHGKPTTIFNGWPKCKVEFDRKCGVADWTIHDVRRTVATNLAALSVPPHVTERILNHVSGTVSGVAAIYNRHAYLDEMREAFAAWEKHLTKLIAAC
jgi:integrase